MKQKDKIIPSLWFTVEGGNALKVVQYYTEIFEKDFRSEKINVIGQTPSGNTENCQVYFFGNIYNLLCTSAEHHALNDAFSITLNCEDQDEIDKFWNYFTLEGRESQCGWCIDKFGLRWQILPKNLGELLSKPASWKVMMKQRKIIIAEYA